MRYIVMGVPRIIWAELHCSRIQHQMTTVVNEAWKELNHQIYFSTYNNEDRQLLWAST